MSLDMSHKDRIAAFVADLESANDATTAGKR